MRFLIEIATQNTKRPTKLGNHDNPDEPILLANGWRWADDSTIPAVQDGYERGPVRWGDAGDGVNAVAEYTDTFVSDRVAAEAAADKAANLPRWCYENAFLLVCQSHFGTLEKRGTAELLKKGFEMMETGTPVAQVMGAFGLVISIDKELTRMGGDLWWDSVTWHNDADAIAGAQQILGVA